MYVLTTQRPILDGGEAMHVSYEEKRTRMLLREGYGRHNGPQEIAQVRTSRTLNACKDPCHAAK